MFDNKKETNRFELVILTKDAQGNLTGGKKSSVHKDGASMSQHWNLHNGIPRKSKKKKANAPATTQKEIADGLNEVEGYVQRIRKARKLED